MLCEKCCVDSTSRFTEKCLGNSLGNPRGLNGAFSSSSASGGSTEGGSNSISLLKCSRPFPPKVAKSALSHAKKPTTHKGAPKPMVFRMASFGDFQN